MLKINFLFLLSLSFSLFSFAQTTYTVAKDEKHPDALVFKGLISRDILEHEPSFKWYFSNQETYHPSDSLIKSWHGIDSTIRIVIFGGTWCDDTQYILPRFLKWAGLGNFSDTCISIFGVDRNKKTLGEIAAAFQITNVPTFIIMKNGKEAGRVVEYGKTGNWDEEIADIIRH